MIKFNLKNKKKKNKIKRTVRQQQNFGEMVDLLYLFKTAF